jgi:hypothetical protein
MTDNAAKPNYADRPSKLRLYRLRVDSLTEAKKWPGRYVVEGALGEKAQETKLWMSHKQALSVQKNLDADVLWCVVDVIDPAKPRFVWASNNREWLCTSFLKLPTAPESELGEEFEDMAATTVSTPSKAKPKPPRPVPTYIASPTRFEADDAEELPF